MNILYKIIIKLYNICSNNELLFKIKMKILKIELNN